MNLFVFLSFYFRAKNGSRALSMENSLVVRRVSPGRIIAGSNVSIIENVVDESIVLAICR